jgi:methylenetetrahydrofolate dehydrogenase (NADP+) / methenyltetrahydrofolate cyclohydrolase
MLQKIFSFVKRSLIDYYSSMAKLLEASTVRKKITRDLKARCKLLKEKSVTPFLKVILVGNDPASIVYTKNKKKYCEKVGAQCEIIELEESTSEKVFLDIISQINSDKNVHGCIIQLPLPKHLQHLDVGHLIHKEKDVDGFNPENLYALLKNRNLQNDLVSCTPKGILTLLKEYEIEVSGKSVVVIGRSMIVGKPLALLLLNSNATVTMTHSHTHNLKELTKKADIIVCALGKAKFLNSSFLNDSGTQIIIDVGMNNDEDGELCGDVDFDNVVDHVSAITPVPGGVGPMTIVSLVQNLLQATEKELSI